MKLKMKNQFVLLATTFALATSVFAANKPIQIGDPKAPQQGTFLFNLGEEPSTLNPITATDFYSRKLHELVMDTLLVRNQETYDWDPGLAEKYEISKDGKVFTFYIRKNATFHDGKPVTAEDVKFSYDAIFDPAFDTAHLRPYFENFEKAEVVDPYTIKFYVKTKYFGNLESLADTMFVSPKHFYGNAKEGAKKNKTVMGSGPYKLDSYDQGQKIVLVRNPNWWGNSVPELKGKYNFSKVLLRFVKEEQVELEMVKKGQIDFAEISPEVYEVKAVGDVWGTKALKFKVENLEPKSYGYLGWNLRRPMFKDREMRIALTHLMNRDLMNKKFRQGMSLLATGPWYQQSEYADQTVKPIPFDPKKAAQLLTKLGWKDTDKDGVLDKMIDGKKTDLAFTLLYGGKDSEKYWTLYQEDLKKAGIKMELKQLEWNSLLKNVKTANFDVCAMAWGGGSVDNDPKQIWHTSSIAEGGSNYVGYSNPEADRLMDQIREELDKKKRIVLMRKIYRMIAEDAPYTFLFNPRYYLYVTTDKIMKVKPTNKFAVGREYWYAKQAD